MKKWAVDDKAQEKKLIPGFSRQQMIAWGAVGLVILLIGANYLRGQISSSSREEASPVTVGLKEERTTASARLKVHIVGAVSKPGLYEADPGSRVADALALAGGATEAADLNQVNLAAKIADGQQLVVPVKGVDAGPGALAAGSASTGSAGPAGQPVNLNSASQAQLEELEGVGPKTAQKIVEYRDAHGGFKSIEELMEVPGIGPAKFDQIKGQVVV